MKLLRIAVFVSLVALSATVAWAQFGLYGSPEMLRLPPPDPVVVPYSGYAAPSAFPFPPAVPPARALPTAAAYAPAAGGPSGPLTTGAVAAQYANTPAPPRIPAAPAPPNAPPTFTSPSPSDAPVQGPSVVDQMLSESDNWGGAGGCQSAGCDVPSGCCSSFTQELDRFERAVLGPGGNGSVCPWYGSAYALVMSRNKANDLWLSYEDGNSPNNELGPYDWEWCWGGEVRFGRRFCCGCSTGCGDCGGAGGGAGGVFTTGGWALEGTYWTLDMFSVLTIVNHVNGVSTTLVFNQGNVSFGGSLAQNWFDGADEHRVQRSAQVHSAEASLVRYKSGYDYGYPFDLDWSLGVRYFRFDERLVFSSLRDTGSWSVPSDVAYLDDHVTNNLLGFQFGLDATYHVRPGWSVFLTPEFGIYNNHIVHDFRLHLGDGTVATQTAYPGQTYPVHSTEDGFSFLTQVDLGLDWQFSRRWSARVGYRVVVATGIALTDNQIPFYVTDIPGIRDIDHNGELILHGAFFGLACNF